MWVAMCFRQSVPFEHFAGLRFTPEDIIAALGRKLGLSIPQPLTAVGVPL